ncbi:methyltransferase [Amycolatopsis sp. NPDC059657]|uniref:methyltransferase n=1 Tax=Amycolatopsis sp. NPDC059657 TaxID=3346899 RepID=UPI003671FD72
MSADPGQLLPMLAAYIPAKVLQTMASLEVPDLLGEQDRTVDELAELTGTHAPSLERLLRAAGVLGLLQEIDGGKLRLTELGSVLRKDTPNSVRNFALLSSGSMSWPVWGELESTVRTGEPAFEKVHGKNMWAYMDDHPELKPMFSKAMSEATISVLPDIVATFDPGEHGTLVDVGGGNGLLIAALLGAHPELRGVLADTSGGLNDAPAVLAEAGVTDRCETVEVDFFESVPAGYDAYLLKSVIHDWPDERAAEILRVVRAAAKPHSVLYLIEFVMTDKFGEAPNVHAIMSDLNLMLGSGSRERTREQFKTLLAEAGFELDTVTPCGHSGFSVLRAVPGER